ncbi:hypothetical protein BDQ17DRAFT_1418080 [Cyathus striatus]|nr:hypothetical protein BDQ17DRAFT_1418080 [Cyathus striatus]
MSSDDYFGDDTLDDAIFDELDAIETAHLNGSTQPLVSTHPLPPAPARASPNGVHPGKESSFCDLSIEFNDTELERLDAFIADSYQGKAQPVAGPSKPTRTPSSAMLQTTLDGQIASTQTNKSRSQLQRTASSTRNPFGRQPRKTKQWDHTEFAKTGLKQKGKQKKKGRTGFGDGDEEEEEVEFEQFPAPFLSVANSPNFHFYDRPPPPMKLAPDLIEAKHWIFPTNRSKRDYQFNIIKNSLFDNTIVALPTGLGKTFIAGVVMLNYYRWFPEGKVLFVAPTKPLVAQQIDACHQTCGIPGHDAIELTGAVNVATRARYWKQKRIFYMTPQTLVNDLMNETCDARDIILLVVDEAHRATGDYAYNQVVRLLMAKNPHFRLLALTATPGSNPDAVQTLVDGLHISRIEIRDENSLDLKPYMHEKVTFFAFINILYQRSGVKILLMKLMESFMSPLRSRQILGPWDKPETIHPFRAQALVSEVVRRGQGWACGDLTKISSLARAMSYLMEATIGMCFNYIKELSLAPEESDTVGPGTKGGDKYKKLRTNQNFQAVLRELESQRSRSFTPHPKMERLKALIVQHFGEQLDNAEEQQQQTKAMVFVTFREAVDEIVEALNAEKPLIRAHKFIGQGTDKQGKRGLAQSEQLDLIKQFKAGEFNVLVATSIGEEGLDIGEVDLIVCYDAQKTPIRMLQRSGRTGRKRAGFVHVLLSEGREELNFDKAKAAYKEVQRTIVCGEQLELYGDVERLLPAHVKPECMEKRMEIQEYVREDGRRKKGGSPAKGTKRKRNDDVARNIPTGASTGFVSVSELLVKGTKKQKKASVPRHFEQACDSDEDDHMLESGMIIDLPHRSKSLDEGSKKGRPGNKGRTLRRVVTTPSTKICKKKRKKKESPVLSLSQFSDRGKDDSDDMKLERGLIFSSPSPSPIQKPTSPSPVSSSPGELPIRKKTKHNAIDLSDTNCTGQVQRSTSSVLGKLLEPTSVAPLHQEGPVLDLTHTSPVEGKSMAWLVDDDDEDHAFDIVDSSPVCNQRQLPSLQEEFEDSCDNATVTMPSMSTAKLSERSEAVINIDDSIDIVSASNVQRHTHLITHNDLNAEDESIEFILENIDAVVLQQPSGFEISHRYSQWDASTTDSSSYDTFPDYMEAPQPSFPVRATRRLHKRQITIPNSPEVEMPPPSQRRLHRKAASTPVSKRNKSKKPSLLDNNLNSFFDVEADHSGDEASEGYSNSDENVEDEYDRQFIKNSPLTQVSPSYNQTLAYRQSLLSQAPAGSRVPAFANDPLTACHIGMVHEDSTVLLCLQAHHRLLIPNWTIMHSEAS